MRKDKPHRRIGIGILVWDHVRVVLAARSTTRSLLVDPIVAKALVAIHAMVLCREMGFFDIILEGNALHCQCGQGNG